MTIGALSKDFQCKSQPSYLHVQLCGQFWEDYLCSGGIIFFIDFSRDAMIEFEPHSILYFRTTNDSEIRVSARGLSPCEFFN